MSKEKDMNNIGENPELDDFREKLRSIFESAPKVMSPEQINHYSQVAELELFRGLIRLNFPSFEDWKAMSLQRRATFVVGGLHLNEIAERFRIAGNPMGNDDAFMELGYLIYKDDSESAAE